MNDSRKTVISNIHILQIRNQLHSYRDLSLFTNINENTIKSWFSSKNISPKLTTLDKLCDSFAINTADLFIPNSTFDYLYTAQNNSRANFIYNIKCICLKKKLLTSEDLYLLLKSYISRDTLKSYLRKSNGRLIPIYNIDLFAKQLQIEPYKLLLPKENKYAKE